jgi:hypothetical protein
VGEAEFRIDFGTLDRSQVPPAAPAPARAVARGRAAPVALAPPGPAPAGGGISAIDTTVIAEAQRARYVRDTLARFSAGLEKGRDASAHEQDGRTAGPARPAGPAGPG